MCARMLVIAAGLALLIFVAVQLRVVVISVASAVLLAALLAPLVQWLHDHRVPRSLATGLVMVGGLAALGGLLTAVVNTLVDGTSDLIGQLTISVASLQGLVDATPFDVNVEQLGTQLLQTLQDNQQTLTSGAVSTAATVGEVLAGFALCLFALIFMLYDGSRLWSFLRLLAPARRRERVDVAGRRAFASLVGYVRATVLVAIVDAIGIGLRLWITGVPLALPLTALVFVGAFVPIVGAVLTGGGIAVLIALVANGIGTALVVLGVVLAVQQLESHVLQPVLMGRAVRLHPLAIALAVAAGVVIAGITGALLAVPLMAVLTAAVRSLAAPHEVAPEQVDPLLPRDANPATAPPVMRDPAVRAHRWHDRRRALSRHGIDRLHRRAPRAPAARARSRGRPDPGPSVRSGAGSVPGPEPGQAGRRALGGRRRDRPGGPARSGERACRVHRRRRRLLPRALAVRHRLRRHRPAGGADPRRGCTRGRGEADRLPGRPTPRRRSGRAVGAPGVPGGGGGDPAAVRGADGRPAGRSDPRVRLGELRDAAPPDRAAAGDGHPPLGPQPHPADRGAGRAALPDPGRGDPGGAEPDLRHRRSGRPVLHRDDAPLRRRRRPGQAPGAAGAGAVARAVGPLGERRDPGAEVHREAAHRVTGARGRLHRERHRRPRAGSARWADRLRAGRRARPRPDHRRRGGDPLVRRDGGERAVRSASERPGLGRGQRLPRRARAADVRVTGALVDGHRGHRG
ncbi:putative integral membrane protein [Pseudonocardia sp. Ae168_Ps1]|nr:putative integral membrane protein [Pseudonocardia sp. Ae168_Ps1]OLL84911.1 putative integral membrane protein [Pseudonocardia sp. Ae263_Ps1]OLL95072.1 putative integral membrane protein [Pseudonocardia sp. Ae356_Ps1]